MDQNGSIFVVLNPVAGSCVASDVYAVLDRHFGERYQVYETTGGGSEPLTEIVRAALDGGCGAVVAIGGDGTVSGVAEALIGTDVPLGVVAVGTANVFAQELGLPLDLEGACRLLTGEHDTTRVDVMRVGNQHFVLQIGIGIDSLMIRDTDRQAKRRFGRAAYLWTLLTRLIGYQPVRFTVDADSRRTRVRGVEVVVANGGTIGMPPFRWGQHIRPDDGRVDVCVIGARTALDSLWVAWDTLRGHPRRNPRVRYLSARRSVVVSADKPLPIQADGEIIGDTPLHVQVVPHALHVIVPVGEAGRRAGPEADRSAA